MRCPLDASKEELAELLQKELKKSYAATEEYMKQEAIKKEEKRLRKERRLVKLAKLAQETESKK